MPPLTCWNSSIGLAVIVLDDDQGVGMGAKVTAGERGPLAVAA
jgi:hypothetical protein